VALLFSFLQGKGVDMDQMLQIVDPLNPQVFNPNSLISVARNITGASIPALLAQRDDQKAIAQQYELSPQFVNSYLPEDSGLMRSVLALQQSLGNNLQGGSQRTARFRSLEEADLAVQQGRIPIGSMVEVVGPDGSLQSFMVEE
jgi:hypothetical protein